MTKAEQYVSELRKLKTDDNKAIVEGLISGFSAILTDSYKTSGLDPKSFCEMESYRKNSALSTKAFVESVGKEIIESSYSDDTKMKLLENLDKYSRML